MTSGEKSEDAKTANAFLSSSFTKRLLAAFKVVDSSHDGRINLHELSSCLKELHVELEEDDIEAFKSCECEDVSGLSFDGFVRFVKLRLDRIFREIDLDGSGFIDGAEVNAALQRLGVSLSARQVNSILCGMDRDGNNKIDFNEFCAFFSDIPSPSLKVMAKKWAAGLGLDYGSDLVPVSLPPTEMPLIQFVCAGGVAGVASRTLTAPIEKIKILAQTSNTKYEGFRSTMRNIFVKEGVSGLFAGNFTNCLRIFPNSSLVCLVYSRMIKYTPVDNVKNPNQPMWRFVSGATAGLVSTTATHPLDVVRARLTVQDSSVKANNYSGIGNTFRTILAEEGIRGFYKGLGPTALSIAPFMGVQQTVYDVVKLTVTDGTYFEPNAFSFLVCGAFAGMAAQTVVHPLDVVRRQMQVARGPVDVTKSTLSAVRQLWASGGVGRLYVGLTTAYLKAMPAASISLLVRDALLGRLED